MEYAASNYTLIYGLIVEVYTFVMLDSLNLDILSHHLELEVTLLNAHMSLVIMVCLCNLVPLFIFYVIYNKDRFH